MRRAGRAANLGAMMGNRKRDEMEKRRIEEEWVGTSSLS